MSLQTRSVTWQDEVRRVARRVRMRVLEHVLNNNGGYMSQACSSAETLAALYLKIMNLGPSEAPMVPLPFPGVPGPGNQNYFTGAAYNGPRAPHLDRFYLSPAHYALVLYATLIEVGRMAPEGLAQFNQDGSTVEMIGAEHSPGMEVTTGSLGQGLSQAIGVALARRLRGETGRTWVYMSDGEFQEGQTWEAMQFLAFYKLDSVGIYVDVNGQQCDGAMEAVMPIEPLKARLEAFGARVFQVDGHDPDALAAPAALQPDGQPLVVLAYTDPCKGLELLRRNAPKLHYLRFKSQEERELYAAELRKMQAEEGM
ncbi:transketolase [Symbiobacterium terraclitae]|uniref:transketolase n=1 Tax=Symbiobacterium terraclitae TaxID=557451 RepID=UPI0035B557AF